MSCSERYVNSTIIGNPVPPKPNKPVIKVLNFVEKNLTSFIKEYRDTDIKNESGLTQSLCNILNCNADSFPFWFAKEDMEDKKSGISPRIDIAVKTRKSLSIGQQSFERKDRFFAFEAKILGVKTKYRKQEYVIGKDEHNNPYPCGGIERFKRCLHAEYLQNADMIGYVLKEDFSYWFKEINSWIDELIMKSNTDNIS